MGRKTRLGRFEKQGKGGNKETKARWGGRYVRTGLDKRVYYSTRIAIETGP